MTEFSKLLSLLKQAQKAARELPALKGAEQPIQEAIKTIQVLGKMFLSEDERGQTNDHDGLQEA